LQFDDDIIVAGTMFNGHKFMEGHTVPISGCTCPWNTFALWRTSVLSLTGFPLISEGLGDDIGAGVEVCAGNLYIYIYIYIYIYNLVIYLYMAIIIVYQVSC
jgi:hypothetical protein